MFVIFVELVDTLHYQYSVQNVYGIKGGFHGFHLHGGAPTIEGSGRSPGPDSIPTVGGSRVESSTYAGGRSGVVLLTPELVCDIHHQGGIF